MPRDVTLFAFPIWRSAFVRCKGTAVKGSGCCKRRGSAFASRSVVKCAQLSADDEAQRRRLYQGRQQKTLLRIHARRPVFTYVLIAINSAIFITQKLSQLMLYLAPFATGLPNLQALGAKISIKIISGELWRLLTAAFLHVNMRHLLLNSYALYALGSATEILYGGASFLSIYLAGAIGGNLASLLACTMSARPSVGSSGAVFSLIAAMCVHLERNRKAIGPAARENLKLVALATALNLAGGWLMPSVDGWAHFGGCLFGMFMGMWLVPRVVLHKNGETGIVTYVEVRRRGVVAGVLGVVVAAVVACGVVLGVGVLQ